MSIEIKTISGRVLYYTAGNAADVREAVVEAASQGANLRDADLRDAYLQGADLQGANLRDADLRDAYLQGADLRGANLRDADLRDAYLRDAYLQCADLQGANLQGADLQGANLRDAYLQGANLRGADLRDADLRGADLRGADLRDAYLQGADLRGADLQGAKNVPGLVVAQLSFLPEGSLIGWEKAGGGAIVKLKIPAKARRSHGTGRKCRADRAKVLSITAPDGTTLTEAHSQHDLSFVYRVGETVTPVNGWGEDRWEECAPGIHFYITREEAEAY